jgi:hypothetical protein
MNGQPMKIGQSFRVEVSSRKVINFRHCATSKFINLGSTQDEMPHKFFIWQHGVVNQC